jgi:hypothetical protein
MIQLNNKTKKFLLQTIFNSYEGNHGKVDWSIYKKDSINKWNVSASQGFTAEIQNHSILGNALIICFRGSDEGEIIDTKKRKDDDDWGYNFDFKQVQIKLEDGKELIIPYGNNTSKILMHHGFIKHYNLVRNKIRTAVKDAINKNLNIIITGHSLGGAVTTVCTADIHYMITDEMKLKTNCTDGINLIGYAASSPKVGNKAFVESFNKRMSGFFYNERFSDDPVSKVPLGCMDYYHVANEKTYENVLSILSKPVFGFLPLAVWYHHPMFIYNSLK